ncbi:MULTISPECIES: hypothetical protein [unclassified Pseudomonas]|uniref:hypothetical protein n=1 Tax=unclassified Pseudomonas TaxID=196821 RepID=UPI000C86D05C|nr:MULTISPECIES: hypothetical protein [unclassified Pseudomonas]PMV24328.1 hypothetical protein C1X17_09315 [Pseudomonas sp. FW305-3-2-15-C-TSA2]PMV30042.1 hypothetical protein C1X22_09135 [Pseudomonas sp. DP16D-L5]PMV40338.1 hypothetical protein C1X21_08210 [Pseudomonas sp. FW305-3-2-15-A-LB2]PMV47085.1 hypothetical protein C1X16_08545 [Pseudomonas sp. FW305-3-2-15-C-R2A1]PMV52560.1 hypothetical protein C1X18_09305 [Pseudomonas sp. FW305-3-2-15-C-LB1]
MPTIATINQPAVSGFGAGSQPKIYNATPPGSFATPPQNMPVVTRPFRYLVLSHFLSNNTRIGDVLTYYCYPVPSAGLPTMFLEQITLTAALLQIYINNKREHFEKEIPCYLPNPGVYDVYWELENASQTYTEIRQNLRFTVV